VAKSAGEGVSVTLIDPVTEIESGPDVIMP
jgi:hypothetical protein